MIYELRTYWAATGRLDALHERFRTVTRDLFVRHGFHMIGFWTPEPRTAEAGDLVYLLAFDSLEDCTRKWDAFNADPDWQAAKAASERAAGGRLVASVRSQYLAPTDYSPPLHS